MFFWLQWLSWWCLVRDRRPMSTASELERQCSFAQVCIPHSCICSCISWSVFRNVLSSFACKVKDLHIDIFSTDRNRLEKVLTWIAIQWQEFLNLLLLGFWAQCLFCPSCHRKPYHHGKEPCVSVQPSGAGEGREGGEGEGDPNSRDPSRASGLDLCPERAAGEAGHWHEARDGEKVCTGPNTVMLISWTVSPGILSLVYDFEWLRFPN